jgi:putative transposase
MGFIDDMRAEGHAVESTCRVLREQGCPVAARTYRAWRRGCRPAARTISDAVITDAILATAGTPEELYGRRKMTHHLRRAGHRVAFCTVHRLMRDLGRTGIRRGKGVRTTISAKDADRPSDLLQRQFRAEAPNRVWVADFTYARTWAGFSYVAFIVDVFAQRIVAWHAATDKRTDLVLTPLRIALWDRHRKGHPILAGQLVHHHDAGSQLRFKGSSQHRLVGATVDGH